VKTAYVFVPCFAVAVERRRRPSLSNLPLIVGGYPYERKTVFDASSECLQAGVRLGMPLRQAQYLCPEATFLPSDVEAYEQAFQEMLSLLDTFSPAVEVESLGGAYLDAAGLSLLYGNDETLASKIVLAIQKRLALPAQVGVSISKLAAMLSARSAGPAGIRVVTIGELRRFLEELPTGSLSLPDEALERLRWLGIHTIGQFLRLPASEIKDQLGEEASLAYHALLGLPGERVEPRPSRSRLRQYQEMEHPLFGLGELSPVLAHLVSKLADALAARYQYSQALTLRLELETGKSWEASTLLKEPTGERRVLMEAAQRLALQVPSDEAAIGIAGVEIILESLGREVGRQLKLFDTWADRQRRRAQLSSALALIQRRFGDRLRELSPEPSLSLPLSR